MGNPPALCLKTRGGLSNEKKKKLKVLRGISRVARRESSARMQALVDMVKGGSPSKIDKEEAPRTPNKNDDAKNSVEKPPVSPAAAAEVRIPARPSPVVIAGDTTRTLYVSPLVSAGKESAEDVGRRAATTVNRFFSDAEWLVSSASPGTNGAGSRGHSAERGGIPKVGAGR